MRRATALCTAALLLLLCRAALAGDCGDWQASLDQHNSYRAIHGVPSLTWSSSLADGSRSWSQQLAASGCSLQHSGGNYGENLYAMYGSANPGCVTAVQGWYSEIKNYRFTSTPWSDNTFSQIGHFSQVVWKGTTQVGCAAATGSNCWVVTCRYSPPGNYIGDSSFFANVLPPNSNPVSPTPPPVFPSPQPSPLPPSPQPSPVWPSPQPSPVWPSPMPDPSPMPTPSPQPNPSPPQPLPSPLLKSPAPLPSPKPKKSPKPLPLPSPYRRTPSPAPEPSPMPQPSPWVDPSPQPPPPCEDMFRQCWRYSRFCAPRYYFARIRRPVRDVCPQTCNNCPVQVSGVIYLNAPEE